MQYITYSGKSINFEAIVEQYRAALVGQFVSATLEDDRLTVELADGASPAAAKAVYDAHDATQLSERQQLTAVRQAQLDSLRTAVANRAFTAAQVDALDEPFKLLAQKIQWLEFELRAMRGEL